MAIKHLRGIDIMKKSGDSNAASMAKALLDFHANLIWIDELELGQSSSGKRKRGVQTHAKASQKRSK